MDDLPSDYDAIVLGTGMTECIVAAALARIGYSVLHLDRNDYYSGEWASFHFEALQRWISKQKGENEDLKLIVKPADEQTLLKAGEHAVPVPVESTSVSHIQTFTHISDNNEDIYNEKSEDENAAKPPLPQPCQDVNTDKTDKEELEISKPCQEVNTDKIDKEELEISKPETKGEEHSEAEPVADSQPPIGTNQATSSDPQTQPNIVDQQQTPKQKWTYSAIQKQWRRFNIDLAPKLLYCRGSFVELLISSDVAKYCEFKTVTRILTHINDKLEQVPCSRSDVFSSKAVSMIEKRMMMKFITFCVEFDQHPEEYTEFSDKPFGDFLKSRKLTGNVQHYILHSIAMVPESASTIEGLRSCQLFLQSLGRYGNTAFLWPVYGSGEIPQCLVRMCAVFGGIYCLRRTAAALIMDTESNKYTGIIDTEGKRLNSKWIIMDASYAAEAHLPTEKSPRSVSRCILLTDRSLLKSDSEHITLVHLPARGSDSPSTMLLELSSSSSACPKDLYIVHLTCVSTKSAKEELDPVVNQFFIHGDKEEESERPRVLWSLYFNCVDNTQSNLNSHSPENVFITCGPGMDLDFAHSVQEAKHIFEKICPGEDFLPRAPNPEDIIYDDGEQKAPADPGFQAEESAASDTEKSAEQIATSQADDKTSHESVATNQESEAASHESVATSQESEAASHESVATSQESVATSHESVATSQESAATNNEV